MKGGWELSDKSLAVLKMDLESKQMDFERKTTLRLACKERHNGQRQLIRWMEVWEGKYGLTMERIVDCYWNELLAWMELRHVRFEPTGTRVVAQLLQWVFDQDKYRFETLLELKGVSLEQFFDLRRTAIQKTLMQRGCVKYRVIVDAAEVG